jgi:hypothetical protein
MKFPSPLEQQLMACMSAFWHGGKQIRADYLKKFKKELPNGTFYTTLRRMISDGWVKSRKPNPKCSEDQRQRYFHLTAGGCIIAKAITKVQSQNK